MHQHVGQDFLRDTKAGLEIALTQEVSLCQYGCFNHRQRALSKYRNLDISSDGSAEVTNIFIGALGDLLAIFALELRRSEILRLLFGRPRWQHLLPAILDELVRMDMTEEPDDLIASLVVE
jgi:hypothetical protein